MRCIVFPSVSKPIRITCTVAVIRSGLYCVSSVLSRLVLDWKLDTIMLRNVVRSPATTGQLAMAFQNLHYNSVGCLFDLTQSFGFASFSFTYYYYYSPLVYRFMVINTNFFCCNRKLYIRPTTETEMKHYSVRLDICKFCWKVSDNSGCRKVCQVVSAKFQLHFSLKIPWNSTAHDADNTTIHFGPTAENFHLTILTIFLRSKYT